MNEPSVFNGQEVSMPRDALQHDDVQHRKLHNVYDDYIHMATSDGPVKRGDGKDRPEWMVERNVVSWNAMIMGYAKAGYCVPARVLFDEMPRKDVISWISTVTGYAQAAQYKDAIRLVEEMMVAKIKPDEITVASDL
ncbi:Hypothetical predicted protein [Olea europaea subsp. europaea]|uniref:Pentatricopeptide repeat-containing protein n=1 Tax=Olea europaea subsp. europaea TaxID=158383 RepID=A0A8S0QU34_OLEEU|nr:Hypothetical predicted protein [Olea europaea subsp. europaea]